MDTLEQVKPLALINLFMIPRGSMIKVGCEFHRQSIPQSARRGTLPIAPSLHPAMTAPKPSTTSPRSTTFLMSLTPPERNFDTATAAISSHRNWARSSCWVGRSRSLLFCTYCGRSAWFLEWASKSVIRGGYINAVPVPK